MKSAQVQASILHRPNKKNKAQQQILFLCGRRSEDKVTIIEYNSSKLGAETWYLSSETWS